MHKHVLKIFEHVKTILEFIKIAVIFSIMCLLLYWVETLIGAQWDWLNFIRPILVSFVKTGASFTDGSIYLFDAKFEYKYFIALILFLAVYYFDNLLILASAKLEELYCDSRNAVKKYQEDSLNIQLAQQHNIEQKRLKRFQIYVSTKIKKKYSHQEQHINIEEQNDIMNKFLIEKTGTNPTIYENGFLYTFEDFETADNVLKHFFKLIKSSAPLDYIICVQILGANPEREIMQLKELASLNFINKITMLSDTMWRYRHKKAHRFGTSQVGLFQKGQEIFEVHEFIEI